MMNLSKYSTPGFDRGATRFKEAIWLIFSGMLVESWLPGSSWRCLLLRLFGAKIGNRVTIKPRVRVKFPWRLQVADDVWIGEEVWIDNLGMVSIDHDVCISQGAYLCTGSHDWGQSTFDLVVKPIVVSSHSWIGAMSRLAPGTRVGKNCVIGMGVMIAGDLEQNHVFTNSQAVIISKKPRRGITFKS